MKRKIKDFFLILNKMSFDPDTIRGHAFQFKLKVPIGLKNWNNEKREEILTRLNIKWEKLDYIFGGGQKIVFRGKKVHLTNKSIIIYDKGSYYADTSKKSQTIALIKVLYLVKALEQKLRVGYKGLSIKGHYMVKPTRQHYSLIKNALARIYNKPIRQKLEVCDEKGLWLIVDNSWNLEELECINSQTSPKDSQGMKNMLNSFRQTEFKVTSEFILESLNKQNIVMNGIQQNQMMFAKNMESHIKAVQELGEGVRKLTKVVEDIKK